MKKLSLLAIVSATAFFAACGDDSSSSPSSKELPKSVKTFFDLADVECTADAKCATIVVEDDGDTYECNGKGQWNMLIESMPSQVCPAENSSDPKDEEDGDNTDDQPASGDKPAAGDSGDKPAAGDSGDKPAAENTDNPPATSSDSKEDEKKDEPIVQPSGDIATCYVGGLLASCYVIEASKASLLKEGLCDMAEGTMGTTCPEGIVAKCPENKGVTEYLYHDKGGCIQ